MKQIYLLLALVLSISMQGQNIQLDFPALNGKKVLITLKNGIQKDTIFTGKLDLAGKVNIPVEKAYQGYAGMASLEIENGTVLDFIVNNENVTIYCPKEQFYGNDVVFKNSLENTALQSGFIGQSTRQQKIQPLSDLKQLYAPSDKMYTEIDTEIKKIFAEQIAFDQELKTSNLYASKFINFYNFTNTKVANIHLIDPFQVAQIRNFVKDSLDINNLYTSGLWYETLNGLVALYVPESRYHSEYINDMSLLLQRCQSDKVYMTLAENLFTICESTGWADQEEQLAYFLINDGRIKNPQGKLKLLMTLFKLSKGNTAPLLANKKPFKGTTLLVFHESGCGNCAVQMQHLADQYPSLIEKGIDVISVSADMNQGVFDTTAAAYPWKDKYCDLKGTNGDDFKNYGIIGTPTFYLIKDGKVAGRYAQLSQVKF